MRWALCLLMVAGCGEYCEYAETICDGERILSCVQSDGFADHSFADLADACEVGEVCVDTVDGVGVRRAVCSFTGELDDRCVPEGLGVTHVCADSETVIACNAGYAASKRDCTGACVTPGNGSSFCSVDTAPSPTCEARESCESDADGTAVVACRSGYVTARIACADDEDCVRLTDVHRRTYCVSPESCDGSSTWCTTIVDERAGETVRTTVIEGCVLGRVVEMTCSEGTACEVFGVLGWDDRPTGETQAQCIRR
jgi:hypothetical protein